MEASWLYALQGHRRSTVLEGAQNKVSGAQWHTYGAGLGQYATPQSAYIRRILFRVAKVAHHINKYITQVAPYPGKEYPPDPKAA
jgi:hypothetical protein